MLVTQSIKRLFLLVETFQRVAITIEIVYVVYITNNHLIKFNILNSKNCLKPKTFSPSPYLEFRVFLSLSSFSLKIKKKSTFSEKKKKKISSKA